MALLDVSTHLDGVLDYMRVCMLKGDVVIDLDAVALAPAVQRCLIVATIGHECSGESADMANRFADSRVTETLRAEALRRRADHQPTGGSNAG